MQKYVLLKQSKAGIFEEFEYAEFEKHVKLVKYYGNDKVVTIPEKINDKPVITIGIKCFAELEQLEKIILSAEVKIIQTEAFLNCKNLKSISGNLKKTTYAKSAFNGCTLLQR